MKRFFPFFSSDIQHEIPTIRDFREWRLNTLDSILRNTLVLWIIGLVGAIGNVIASYRAESVLYEHPLLIAGSLIGVYIILTALLAVMTFHRGMRYEIRVGSLLFIFYVLGIVGLVFSSFSGDGRIFLFVFVILVAIFFEGRRSLPALAIALFTLLGVAWLQLSGILVVPPSRQVNSTDAGAWFSGVVVFTGLGIIALVSITHLQETLGRSLGEAREALAREKKTSRMFHAISDINQLVIREQESNQLLSKACERLISGLGYGFAWIGLVEADGTTIKLAASAGGSINPQFTSARLDDASPASLRCAIEAIRSRDVFRAETFDVCLGCPHGVSAHNRCSIALPLMRNKTALGALVLEQEIPAVIFDKDEIQLLRELADDLAYALSNLESRERIQIHARRQALLNSITQTALEAPDLEEMLRKFLVDLQQELNADIYYIALWDEDRGAPVQFVGSQSAEEALLAVQEWVTENDIGFSKSLLTAGSPLVVEDIMNSSYIDPRIVTLFPARSALGLPLIAKNQKLGTLIFGTRETRQFSPEEIEFGERASRQVALAVLKARLDQKMRSKATELGRLYAAALDLSFSVMDSPALLEKLAHHATEAVEATSGYIMSINIPAKTVQLVAEYWSESAAAAERKSDLGEIYSFDDYSTILDAMIAGKTRVLHAGDSKLTRAEKNQFQIYQTANRQHIVGDLPSSNSGQKSEKHRHVSLGIRGG